MRKFTKKTFCILTAAAITAGALSLTACGNGFKPVAPDASGGVESNGGFVVSTSDYYYFINGVQDYAADNTYGDVVKGALMRVKKEDVKKNEAETVIPSLMVAGDTNAGIFIYGERIYFATPNNVKSTTGETEKDYLDFKSAKTDGSDVTDILRLSDNKTQYRFVEVDGTVYLLYIEGTNLHSYNTKSNQDTILVKNGTYVFNNSDKSDPYVYYTMSVTDNMDTLFPVSYKYNQIYRVRADATKANENGGEGYTWDQDFLDEKNNGEVPYWNYGELVLDGIGKTDLGMQDDLIQNVSATQFNPDADDMSKCPVIGYTYTLQNYTNGGIYFKRALVYTPTSTVGSEGELYYLPASVLGEGWDTVSGNTKLDIVANSTNLSKASASAQFYLDGGKHHYLYVDGSGIYRADVNADGSNETLQIAFNASGATLVSLDTTSSEKYDYVYYSCSNNGGLSVERAVFNGSADDYSNLSFGDNNNKSYEAVKLLNVQHTSGWYNYEILDGTLFYANNESFGSSLDYVYTVDLKNASGTLMDNEELQAFNGLYDNIFSSDSKVGYLEKVKDGEGGSNYSNALKYYFYTGETKLFWENIEEAKNDGKKDSYIYKNIYTAKQQELFTEFTKEGSEERATFKDAAGNNYFSNSYFTTMLGEMNEADTDTYNNYWKTSVLKPYTPVEEETDGGLAWWAWLLIALAIAAVVAGVGVGVYFFLKKRKSQEPKPEKMRVDTTDDKSVDVYNMNTEAQGEEASETVADEAVEAAEEPVEAPEEETAEEAEEQAEEPAEADAAPEEEAPAETPAEEPAPEETSEEPAPAEAPAEETPAEDNNPYND